MGWLFNRGGDHQLAETKYQGRESATESAARARRTGHRSSIPETAAKGQAWEDKVWRRPTRDERNLDDD